MSVIGRLYNESSNTCGGTARSFHLLLSVPADCCGVALPGTTAWRRSTGVIRIALVIRKVAVWLFCLNLLLTALAVKRGVAVQSEGCLHLLQHHRGCQYVKQPAKLAALLTLLTDNYKPNQGRDLQGQQK